MTKSRPAQKLQPTADRSVRFEDNNGGDLIEVIDNGNNRFTLRIGYGCVCAFVHTGTISEITKVFAEKLYGDDA